VAKKAVKLRIPERAAFAHFFLSRTGRFLVLGVAGLTVLFLGVFAFYYSKYSRVIDKKLTAGPFADSAQIFAAPLTVTVGDGASPESVAGELRRSGYNESRSNLVGYYQLHPNSIEIFPGRDSYFDQEAGVIRFAANRISQIISLADNTQRGEYNLEPQLITNVSGPTRDKRRVVKYQDMPKVLVDAVTSAEDKRFFQHSGFDPIRIIKAAYVDLREGRKEQGASTLSMQLARGFWLDQDKRWTRKLAEVIITLQLEQRLSKEQIFEYYANQIYLGWRGAYHINGFGEASEAYLGKDLSQVTLPEAAMLAGMIQRPSYFNPFKRPDQTRERRNLVLHLMRQNGSINDRDYALAVESPLTVSQAASSSVEAPYFVDMVDDTLQGTMQDVDLASNNYRIYTTLDMRLQRAASEAISAGMKSVDEQVRRQRRFRGQTPPDPQVALVALDPHTGEVKALAGGRNYGMSQLNHVLAKRQPGSIFKPFVYAAALDTGVNGAAKVFTASTQMMDEPTTFWFDSKPYEPSNFGNEFSHRMVTMREALAHSLNVPTVRLAEMVGYDAVVDIANRAGMNYKIQPTPAVALGAYEITPLEAAGAYTLFANQGEYVKPSFISLVRSHEGKTVFKNKPERKQELDPRVAYLVTNLLQEVLRSGTAGGVRARYNLDFPVAGKTGTSHDGWFAGYTSELLCIVWVGFDDNRELNLEGAHSAAPIWADFMKRALQYREYKDVKEFEAPGGIVSVTIDPQSGMPATPSCPQRQTEAYVAGTEPLGSCPLHGGRGGATQVTGWDIPSEQPAAAAEKPSDATERRPAPVSRPGTVVAQQPPQAQPEQPKPQKKGFWQRVLGVFK
jgi:penicillin-binding protein 1B